MTNLNMHRDMSTIVSEMQQKIRTLESITGGPQTFDELAEMRKPAAPTNFHGSPSVEFNPDGTSVSIVNCSWESVHFSNGYEDSFYTELGIKSYEVWAHRLDIEDDWAPVYTVEQPPFTINEDETITPVPVYAKVPLIGGQVLYELRVCALGQDYNNYGDWSQTIQLYSANDLDAPPTPSKPQVSEQAGLAAVSWDGLPDMPVDFAYCEVAEYEFMTVSPDVYGRLYDTEGAVLVTPTYGQDCYYYLRSVDFSGNKSEWSEPTAFKIDAPETGPDEDAIKDWIDESQKTTQDGINKVAQDAAKASEDIKNASIINTEDSWAVSTSETNPPTSGWVTSPPTRNPGEFIWVKTTLTFGSGATTETSPVLLTGNTGVGIKSTTVEYAYSTSGTVAPSSGWNSTVPSVDDEKFLWTRTTITYTNNTTSTSYAISRSGSIGRGVSTSKTDYQLSSSGTNTPSGQWSANPISQTKDKPYLWTKTVFTYTDNTTSTSYSVSQRGTGVESLTSFYQQVDTYAPENYLPEWTTTQKVIRTNLALDPELVSIESLTCWRGHGDNVNIKEPTEDGGIRTTWTTVTDPNSGDVGVKITNKDIPVGTVITVSYKLAASMSGLNTSGPVLVINNAFSNETTIAKSDAIEFEEGESYTVFSTFTVVEDMLLDASFRVSCSILNKQDGVWVEVSDVDIYEGEYDPDRPWFSGDRGDDELYTTAWTGEENASTSTLSAPVINELTQDNVFAVLDGKDVRLISSENQTSKYRYATYPLPDNLKSGGYASATIVVENPLTDYSQDWWWGTIGIGGSSNRSPWIENVSGEYEVSLTYPVGELFSISLGGTGSLLFKDLLLTDQKPEYLNPPDIPTTLEPTSEWSIQEPKYRADTILYKTDRVIYTDGEFSYTEPYLSTSYQAANAAMSAANLVDAAMKGLIQMSTTPPDNPVEGSLWFELDEEDYDIIGLYLYSGTDWVPYTIIADRIIVPGSVGVVSIEEGAIEGLLGAFDTVLSDLLMSTKIKSEHIELGEITKDLLEGDLQDTVDNADAWAEKTLLEPGKITISSGIATGTSLIMTPSRLSFIVGNAEVAYIDSSRQELNIKKAVVRESLKVGFHIIEKYTDSVTIMRWVGA